VVIPTFNERDNIELLVQKLEQALEDHSWEAVFVDDDSPDGTAAAVRAIARRDSRIRCIQRVGRRGLSSAVIEGMLSSSADYFAVLDGDLQHDETLLPDMVGILQQDPNVDVVVGSRYVRGGGFGDWNSNRVAISRFATQLSRRITKVDLTDPMSGFFMIRRLALESVVHRISGRGFKILLDIFASSPRPLVYRELPFEFRARVHGESKLDALVVWEYFALILDKTVGHIVPVRFFMFGLVGGFGVFVHFMSLWLLNQGLEFAFVWSQVGATIVAMTSNFYLNNIFTYRDQQLKGWHALRGLLSFYAVCGFGVIANVGVASFVFEQDYTWWIAGGAGAVVGVVWNFAVSSVFTWKRAQG
jgi:dolichol-phosphate mannosyltransferase